MCACVRGSAKRSAPEYGARPIIDTALRPSVAIEDARVRDLGVIVAVALVSFVLGLMASWAVLRHVRTGVASAKPPDVQTFADPFRGSFGCDGFDAEYSGQDRGRITDYYDNAGNLVGEVGHIHSYETVTNLATDLSVEIRTNATVHADLNPDGSFREVRDHRRVQRRQPGRKGRRAARHGAASSSTRTANPASTASTTPSPKGDQACSDALS